MKHFLTLTLLVFSMLSASADEKIIILNEGNWQSDNGKMSYFENGDIVSNEWFRQVNGYKLGDTPNDIISVNDNLIAVAVNWSNIVQFIDATGHAVAATENVPNNRKLASDGRYVYVTSYGHECETVNGIVEFKKGYVAKIDTENFKVVATCEVGYEPEGIALYEGFLFVANTGGYAFQESHEYETTVSIIDAATMQKIRDVDTGQINLYGKLSQTGKYLCINSPGDYYDIQAATVIFDCEKALSGSDDCFEVLEYAATYSCPTLDGKFLAVGSRFSYYTNEYTFNYITIDPERVMEEGPAGVEEDTLIGSMMEEIEKMMMPYCLYINPYSGYIYATDAASYVEGGTLYQWDPEGNLLGKYNLYINPGHMLALNPEYTSIIDVEALECNREHDNHNTPCYNLQGIRVSNPVPGNIYIRDGKKFKF